MQDQLLTCVLHRGSRIEAEGSEVPVRWWSFGKTVIATAALRLVEDGALSLDGSTSGEPWTLRQLLQHTAGLRDYGELAAYHASVAAGAPAWTRDELLTRMSALPARPPGEDFAYSNLGYMYVAEAIVRTMGKPLGAAIRQLVFEPLGLTRVALAERVEDGYDPAWVYHGLFRGPLGEAALLLDGLMAGQLLSPASLREMRRGVPLPQFAGQLFAKPGYGLGLMKAETTTSIEIEGHTGGGPGSSIAVYHCARTQRTAAVFAADDDVSRAETACAVRLTP